LGRNGKAENRMAGLGGVNRRGCPKYNSTRPSSSAPSTKATPIVLQILTIAALIFEGNSYVYGENQRGLEEQFSLTTRPPIRAVPDDAVAACIIACWIAYIMQMPA
jgi:hypothetical protein